jgi:adenosine kinase
MKIAITGSIAYDYLMTYPGQFREMLIEENLDHLSVSFLVDTMSRHRGGVAANIAYTLALLGEQPLLVGSAGQDFAEYKNALEDVGVDTSGVQIENDLFTASFFVSTDNANNQIASFYPGAMVRSRELTLSKALKTPPDLVVISPNDPIAMRNYCTECREAGILFVYDPSQQVARVEGKELAECLEGCYLLILNEYEQAALCKKTGYSFATLLEHVQTLIITLGNKGADIYSNGQTIHIPICPTEKVVDPTGVGDAFRAGILKGLIHDWDWELSGQVATVAAAYALEQFGTQNHVFSSADFVQRFRHHFNDAGQLDIML